MNCPNIHYNILKKKFCHKILRTERHCSFAMLVSVNESERDGLVSQLMPHLSLLIIFCLFDYAIDCMDDAQLIIDIVLMVFSLENYGFSVKIVCYALFTKSTWTEHTVFSELYAQIEWHRRIRDI